MAGRSAVDTHAWPDEVLQRIREAESAGAGSLPGFDDPDDATVSYAYLLSDSAPASDLTSDAARLCPLNEKITPFDELSLTGEDALAAPR